MPASVTSAAARKGAAEETSAALLARIADLQERLAQRDQEVAWMADKLAAMEAARATAPAPAAPEPEATAKAVAAPGLTAAEREAADLRGLAIVAKEGRHAGDRGFWQSALDRLGRHVAPDQDPTGQLTRALATPEGQAFLEAKISCQE